MSQSWAIFSQSPKIVKFVIFGPLIFLNCARCALTDVSASNYNRKTDARPFDTIHDILRCLSLVQSLIKCRNASIYRNQCVWDSRTGRLMAVILNPDSDLLFHFQKSRWVLRWSNSVSNFWVFPAHQGSEETTTEFASHNLAKHKFYKSIQNG